MDLIGFQIELTELFIKTSLEHFPIVGMPILSQIWQAWFTLLTWNSCSCIAPILCVVIHR